MKEERMRILNLVAEGKVTPEEGARLIEALGEGQEKPPREESPAGEKRPKLLVVKVDAEEENAKVRIALPLSLADLALKFVPRDVLEDLAGDHGVDIAEILARVKEDVPEGKLVDISTDEAKVEITVE